MSAFQFPKSKHVRSLKPKRVFKNYRVYKPILRVEFQRVCVYCREPDTLARAQVFGVDHYKPKSEFPQLKSDYTNLFYCCNICNTYKDDYWPASPKAHRILNPCDDALAKHVRLDASTGRMVPLTKEGLFFEERFRLNAEDAPATRLDILNIIRRASEDLRRAEAGLKRLSKRLADASDQGERQRLLGIQAQLEASLRASRFTIDRHEGTLPLKPLSPRHV